MIAVPHALLLVVDEAQELSGSAVEALAALARRARGLRHELGLPPSARL